MSAFSATERALVPGLARIARTDTEALNAELRCAAFEHNLAAVRVLVRLGARPNARDRLGRTALHWACVNDGTDMARTVGLLRRRDANPDLRDHAGQTPADLARGLQRFDAVDGLSGPIPRAPQPLRPEPAPVAPPTFWERCRALFHIPALATA